MGKKQLDPTIGEGYGVGSLPPGAQDLFGMARLGPDTALDNIVIPWDHNGGYYYYDNEVLCFSHTHTYGAGLPFYGNIGIMASDRIPTISDTMTNGWRSVFSHSEEEGQPGYYQVNLRSPQVTARLTATTNVGVHQYVYQKQNTSRVLLFDVSHTIWGDQTKCYFAAIDLSRVDQDEIAGVANTREGYCERVGGCQVYFSAVVRTQMKRRSFGFWNYDQMIANAKLSVNRTNSGSEILRLGAYLEYGNSLNLFIFPLNPVLFFRRWLISGCHRTGCWYFIY